MPRGPKGEKRPADVIGNADRLGLVDAAQPNPGNRGPYR